MKKIFEQKTCMETQTVFHENGRVSIIPHVTNKNVSLTGDEGRQTVQRGRMITDDDGRSIFHPYMESGIPRYRLMMSTDHGDVKETQSGSVIVTFRLPQDANLKEMLLSEAKEMAKKWDVSTKEELSHILPEIRRETEPKNEQRKAKKSNQKKIKRKGHSRYHSYVNNNNTTKRDFLWIMTRRRVTSCNSTTGRLTSVKSIGVNAAAWPRRDWTLWTNARWRECII